MALVPAKCTNCGASLEVDNTKDAAICQYCGSAFIVEKAIHNITASVVNIYGETVDFVVVAGELRAYKGSETDVTIPDSVTVIGPGAFANCRGLRRVVIPESVTAIKDGAFMGCERLETVILPDNGIVIEHAVFQNCVSLRSIVIPKSAVFKHQDMYDDFVRTSGFSYFATFNGCSNLQRIQCVDGLYPKGKVKAAVFCGTPGYKSLIQVVKKNPEDDKATFSEKDKGYFRNMGVCQHCGGDFRGVLSKTCKNCGRPKDY